VVADILHTKQEGRIRNGYIKRHIAIVDSRGVDLSLGGC